jgi:hypothetical protein
MRLIAVRESDRDVDTGLDIRRGDRVSFLADGEIWSGEWITGWQGLQFAVTNGPQGWRSAAATSFSFPHRGVAPYSLLGRFGGTSYFSVGRSGEQLYGNVAPARLFLRINDDLPGNGNGEFWCLVQVYR